jgi:predicted metalloprotease with PDZ domain
MKKQITFLALLCLPLLSFGQKTGAHSYQIDLTTVKNDQVKVTVDATAAGLGEAPNNIYTFHFPATIPGTYATLDYGRFIHEFLAFDADGNVLKVKKSKNSFRIYGKPVRLEYWADDTFDSKIRKNKVFEPAGTNNQERRNFLLNHAGYFGFFEGQEELPVTLELLKSPTLYGISAMESYTYGNTQVYNARNYHHFLDCPVMVSKPDTTSFKLGGAKVTISVFTENGRELSDEIYGAVETSMKAIEEFLDGDLPVDNYAFIFYIKDYTEFEGLFNGSEFSLGLILKAVRELSGKGFGALEHGNSSVYYLPDFGGNSVLEDMADVCIHEFFHILTPLGLHSEEIGNFDYIDPKMSEHLWLYEGITEYFAGISQVKGGVISKDEYVRSMLREKLVTSAKFPNHKMSFTEMSENVLEKPYKKQYLQVYQRGAVLGALLDIRIMELTEGKVNLRDVILALRDRYGAQKSFKDEEIIAEFVGLVHPDLQDFFDRYITGNEDLPLKEYLSKVGIDYDRSYVGPVAAHPLRDNDVKTRRLRGSNYMLVKKVGKKEQLGLQSEDRFALVDAMLETPYGPIEEGTVIPLQVIRNEKELEIPYTVRYMEGAKGHFIRFQRKATPQAQKLQNLWLGDGIIE